MMSEQLFFRHQTAYFVPRKPLPEGEVLLVACDVLLPLLSQAVLSLTTGVVTPLDMVEASFGGNVNPLDVVEASLGGNWKIGAGADPEPSTMVGPPVFGLGDVPFSTGLNVNGTPLDRL